MRFLPFCNERNSLLLAKSQYIAIFLWCIHIITSVVRIINLSKFFSVSNLFCKFALAKRNFASHNETNEDEQNEEFISIIHNAFLYALRRTGTDNQSKRQVF